MEQLQPALPSGLRLTAETFGRGDLSVALRGPAAESRERWLTAVERAQSLVGQVPGVEAVWYVAGGLDSHAADEPSGTALMFVRLLPAKSSPPGGKPAAPRTSQEIAADIRRALGALPGVIARIAPATEPALADAPAARAPVVLKVFGPKLDRLQAIAEAARARLGDVRGVVDLEVDPPGAVPRLDIHIDRERAARLGITASDIGEVVQAAWLGSIVGTVVEQGQRRDVWVKCDERSRATPEIIGKTLLATAGGKRVPLSSLVEIKQTTGPRVIYGENGKRRMLVAFGVEGGKPSQVIAAAKRELAGLELPEGYVVVWDVP